ncbi:uncharacterized protein LOC135697063 [Ochlerotatus camptorhynchus]|uniref:uncharacterized protein LOC135697063 n=1 Tax=Ochlerotatus camptorhynchus TaxID=644619 RepID=UPI0031CEBE98
MGAKRENTLVVDFSVLPKRPDASAVQKFMYGELKLDIADALNIQDVLQFHNVRNCVHVEMIDAATEKRYFASHHLKHTMQCEKKAYKIPVFVEDETVNVRIHDLPPKTPSTVIIESMRPYGTILSISREMWKNYCSGIHNGVRVVRMKIKQLIPSYLMIDGETTLITYRNQAKPACSVDKRLIPDKKAAKCTKESKLPERGLKHLSKIEPAKHNEMMTGTGCECDCVENRLSAAKKRVLTFRANSNRKDLNAPSPIYPNVFLPWHKTRWLQCIVITAIT